MRASPHVVPTFLSYAVFLVAARPDEHCSADNSTCNSATSASMLQASQTSKAERAKARLEDELLEAEESNVQVSKTDEERGLLSSRSASGCNLWEFKNCKGFFVITCTCETKPGYTPDGGTPGGTPGGGAPPPYTAPTRRRRREAEPTMPPTYVQGKGFGIHAVPGQEYIDASSGSSSTVGTSSSSSLDATAGASSAFAEPEDLQPEDGSSSSLWKRTFGEHGSSSVFFKKVSTKEETD